MDLLAEYIEILRPPSTKTEKEIGNFKVFIDYPELYEEIKVIRKEYQKGRFTRIGNTEKIISEKDYLADIDKMWKDLTDLKDKPEILRSLVRRVPKRKSDGKFCIGRVVLYSEYLNTGVYHESQYGWRYLAIRMKTTSANEAVVYINREMRKW